MRTKPAKSTKYAAKPETPPSEPTGAPSGATWEKGENRISFNMVVALPTAPWLPVTSKKTGLLVLLPLPIRMIQRLPAENGADGGCLIRGAHGDESTAKESVLEILGMLNGYALGAVSEWYLAT